VEDLYIGGCSLTVDQLKVGMGIRDEFTLLKDFSVVGMILIQSNFTRAAPLMIDYFDVL